MQLVDLVPADIADTKTIRANEIAEWIGVTVFTVYAWAKNGRLPHGKRVGPRTILFNAGEVRKALRKIDRKEVSSAKE